MRLPVRLILMLLAAVAAKAAAQTGLAGRLDSILDAREKRFAARYDTAYMVKPEEKWTVKLRANVSGTDFFTHGNISGTDIKADLEADMKATAGVGVSYRGLSLGLVLNPARLSGKNRDYEFYVNAYGNRVGLECSLTSAKTFKGIAERGGQEFEIGQGTVGMTMFQANAYYSFNHRRFSFPAAFTQSQIQKRSCGTWLVAVSLLAERIDAGSGIIYADASTRLSSLCVGIGPGYAHNFVLKKNWLLHVSAMPQVIVASRNRMTLGDERLRTPFRFPMLNSVGRLAVVRRIGSKFFGLSAVVNVWHQGDEDPLLVRSVKWRTRLFYGFRF